jgi:hypothetical protein
MAKFEAEKFCAKAKLQFGMAPALVESFLKYAAQCKSPFHLPQLIFTAMYCASI